MAAWRTKLREAAQVGLLVALTFYLGLRVGELGDRVVNEVPTHGYATVDWQEEAADADGLEAVFAPVRLEDRALPEIRAALEKKIFGGRRASSTPALTEIDAATFASLFTSQAAFETHYQRVFADHRIQIALIKGAFDEIEGYNWRAILLRHGAEPAAGLFVYHHGHDGNPLAFAPPNGVIRGMIERGYDVVIHCMPGIGWNGIGNVRIKTWDGWGYLSESRNERHGALSMIDTGDGHFIKFFVEPVLASIDLATTGRSYDRIVMAGHSGGGWTTTIAAAVDERIDYSVSYAGTLPFFARHKAKDLGDEEQLDSAFYRDFPYPLLYELASGSATKKRVHYQVFNTEDSCCFANESAATFRRYFAVRPFHHDRDLRIAIVRNKGHYMATDAILEIIGRFGPAQAQR